MIKVLRGVIRGRTVELDHDPGLEDGRTVEVVLRAKQLPGPPPGWTPGGSQTAGGMLAEDWTEEDDKLLEQIHQERQRVSRPEIEE